MGKKLREIEKIFENVRFVPIFTILKIWTQLTHFDRFWTSKNWILPFWQILKCSNLNFLILANFKVELSHFWPILMGSNLAFGSNLDFWKLSNSNFCANFKVWNSPFGPILGRSYFNFDQKLVFWLRLFRFEVLYEDLLERAQMVFP